MMSLICSLWHHKSQFFTMTQHRRDNRLDYSQFWGLFPERLERLTFTGHFIGYSDQQTRQEVQTSNCSNIKLLNWGMMKHPKLSPTCYGNQSSENQSMFAASCTLFRQVFALSAFATLRTPARPEHPGDPAPAPTQWAMSSVSTLHTHDYVAISSANESHQKSVKTPPTV